MHPSVGKDPWTPSGEGSHPPPPAGEGGSGPRVRASFINKPAETGFLKPREEQAQEPTTSRRPSRNPRTRWEGQPGAPTPSPRAPAGKQTCSGSVRRRCTWLGGPGWSASTAPALCPGARRHPSPGFVTHVREQSAIGQWLSVHKSRFDYFFITKLNSFSFLSPDIKSL